MRQVGQQQVTAFQNAMAQVQRPCGDGRVAKGNGRRRSTDNSGRHLLQNSRSSNSDNGGNSNDAVGILQLFLPALDLSRGPRPICARCLVCTMQISCLGCNCQVPWLSLQAG